MQSFSALSLQSLPAAFFCLEKKQLKKESHARFVSSVFLCSPFCLQYSILYLLGSQSFLFPFLSINICLLWNPSPNGPCVLFNWLLHWFLISQGKTLLIWRNVSFLNDECELQRIPTPKHAVLHILFLYSIYENVCAPKTHGVFPYIMSFGLWTLLWY